MRRRDALRIPSGFPQSPKFLEHGAPESRDSLLWKRYKNYTDGNQQVNLTFQGKLNYKGSNLWMLIGGVYFKHVSLPCADSYRRLAFGGTGARSPVKCPKVDFPSKIKNYAGGPYYPSYWNFIRMYPQ